MKDSQNQLQEGKNALKCLVFLTLLSFTSFSQNLKGTYCMNFKGQKVDNCITFLENNKFIYKGHCRFGDVGSDYGVGHYEINKNSLRLHFDLTKESYGNYHNIERKKNTSDSIYVSIKVVNKENEVIPSTNIDLGSGVVKTVGVDGVVNFKVKKSLVPKKCNVYVIGYEQYDFYLNYNADYNIVVNLDTSHGCNIIDELWSYKIIEKDDKIILKRNNKEFRPTIRSK
ncbi:hypothetical protein [Aquimarina sp. AU119]|uniref:hypothetical protein n=1 Tax=Aquimarina sp. AU119 TaxID=2108528 RepID=UPI000D699A69|nr:hypothetical protein [Aquimarina sp. AU119]